MCPLSQGLPAIDIGAILRNLLASSVIHFRVMLIDVDAPETCLRIPAVHNARSGH